MIWKIKFHPRVVKEDLKKIDPSWRKRIISAIKKKLSKDPLNYGKPLKGIFKIYRKLKVGDWRVIYKVMEKEIIVLVIKIGIRKDYKVYKEFFHRIEKLF
jgi:mRNA interferase RelE/StbE